MTMNARERYNVNKIKEKIHRKNPEAQVVLLGSHAKGKATTNPIGTY